jgi:hypothetical protein
MYIYLNDILFVQLRFHGVSMHKNTVLVLMIAEFCKIYILNQIVFLEAHYIRSSESCCNVRMSTRHKICSLVQLKSCRLGLK